MLRSRQGTYSIVARDAETGELGVAVQSHWFSVGPIVPWARPGVGAVATQAIVEVAHGPRVLELLADGGDAPSALKRSLGEDRGAGVRQVAAVDAAGRVAAHTGEGCIAYAGHATGDGVSCQANMMASPTVWPAMLEAWERSSGPLASRLMDALDAAEAEGGDARGRQSAAIVVVPAEGETWRESISLRVEDHPEPLIELRRLLRLHEAYEIAGHGDDLTGEGRHEEAAIKYQQAREIAPDSHELRFWAGLGRAQAGDIDGALDDVRAAIEMQPGWRDLLERLPPELSPSASAVLARLRADGGS